MLAPIFLFNPTNLLEHKVRSPSSISFLFFNNPIVSYMTSGSIKNFDELEFVDCDKFAKTSLRYGPNYDDFDKTSLSSWLKYPQCTFMTENKKKRHRYRGVHDVLWKHHEKSVIEGNISCSHRCTNISFVFFVSLYVSFLFFSISIN